MRSVQSTDSDRYARCIQRVQESALGYRRGRDPGAQASTGRRSTCPTGCRSSRSSPPWPRTRSASSARSRGGPTPTSSGWSSASSPPRCWRSATTTRSATRSALEALVRFSDEELKHQELFRRIDDLIGETLPAGYRFDVDPDAVAGVVLGKSTWAVLALTLDIELFTQLHYRQSIEPDGELSELFKDVFLYHWKEESQHAILDELEWKRHDAGLTRRGTRPRGRRVHRAGRRGGRHPPGAGRRRCRLLRRALRARGRGARRRRRSRRVSSRPTAGSTSTPGRRTRGSGRCCPA